jgi:acylpyruvate hydrolase
MKFARFIDQQGVTRIGFQTSSNRIAGLPMPKNNHEPLLTFLGDPESKTIVDQALQNTTSSGLKSSRGKNDYRIFGLDELTILPPIGHPNKIVCMGGNFADHLQEGSRDIPVFPISFLKSPTSLIGHKANIVYPRKVKLLDYEVELAAVIGKHCSDVSVKNALDYVAGYSIFNDVSARDFQFAEMKRGFCNIGKNFATFAPMGPFLVTPDQVGNPDDLGMELRVNGRTRQLSNTKNMVFKIRQLIEFFSSMPLEPGDVITSGTPSGVAIYRKPDRTMYLLKPGDIIEAKIENLGVLRNTVVAQTQDYVAPILTAA